MKNNMFKIIKSIYFFILSLLVITSSYVWYNFGTISPEQILVVDKTIVILPWVQFTIAAIVFTSLLLTLILLRIHDCYIISLTSIISLIFFIHIFGIFKYVQNNIDYSSFYEENLVQLNEHDIKFPNKKRNLIILYVESLDDGYMNSNVTPFLDKLKKDNISFEGFNQLPSTSTTISSQFAGLCGAPLKQKLNRVDDIANFAPKMVCVSEILANNGYTLSYMKSADILFSRSDEFAKQRDFHSIKGYRQLKPAMEKIFNTVDGHAFNGLRDKVLFESAKKELLTLKQPFFLTLTTLDLHTTPEYFVDPDCEKTYRDIRDAVRCTDNNIKDFLSWLKAQEFYDNTTIIIIGDHLMPAAYAFGSEIFNVIINPFGNLTPQTHSWTTYDLPPTILSTLGIDISEFGLGRSLFDKKATLFEKYGYAFENKLSSRNKLYQTFYDDYSIENSYNEYELGNVLLPEQQTPYIEQGNLDPYKRIVSMSLRIKDPKNKKYILKIGYMATNKNFKIFINGYPVYKYTDSTNKSPLIMKNITVDIPEGVIKEDGKAYMYIYSDNILRSSPFGIFINNMSIE